MYLGLFFNIMIMSTVTLAAVKIANVMLGWGRLETIADRRHGVRALRRRSPDCGACSRPISCSSRSR